MTVKPTGERGAFEAWYRDTFSNANSFDLRHDEVAYAYREVDMAWRAWQAAATAHAALVAERDKLFENNITLNVKVADLRAKLQAAERALLALLEHYTALVNCGDCGNWDPETEATVIAARAALAQSAKG